MSVEVTPGVDTFDIVERVLGPETKRNPKQVRFFAALLDRFLPDAAKHIWAEFLLYGGAAGGAKSYSLRWGALLFAMYCFLAYGVKHVRVGLFCEDYPSLRDRQLSKMKAEFPAFLGRMRDDRDLGLIWQLPEQYGENFIAPRNLDKPEKYHSVEFAGAFVDEFTQNKNAAEVFDEIRFRLRWPGFPEDFAFPFVAGTNPGGPGHQIAKDLWVDGILPKELEPKRKAFQFIQALATDNHYLSPKYYKDLLSLPEDLRKAYAFGDWDTFAGQYFTQWRRRVHICSRFKIPHYWERFTAEDWGYEAAWSRIWFAVSPEGRIVAYREQYELKRLPDFMAKEGLRLSAGENVRYKVGDPAMWSESGKSHGNPGPSIAEQLRTHGWTLAKADNNRIAGWQQVRSYLYFEQDDAGNITRPPMFQVMEGTCPNLVRTLPSMVKDKLNPEDCDTKTEDHAPDTLRYALQSRPKLTIVPLEEMADEYAEAALRAAHEEYRGQKGAQWGDLG